MGRGWLFDQSVGQKSLRLAGIVADDCLGAGQPGGQRAPPEIRPKYQNRFASPNSYQ